MMEDGFGTNLQADAMLAAGVEGEFTAALFIGALSEAVQSAVPLIH